MQFIAIHQLSNRLEARLLLQFLAQVPMVHHLIIISHNPTVRRWVVLEDLVEAVDEWKASGIPCLKILDWSRNLEMVLLLELYLVKQRILSLG